jgi:hypothetical protein
MSGARQGHPGGYYERNLQTKAGEANAHLSNLPNMLP